MTHFLIPNAFVGLLYEDGVFKRVLEPGKYPKRTGFFDSVDRTIALVDMRERSLTIKGQEILTRDKVAIRVSLLVYFKVTDAVAAQHAVEDYASRIYEDVQLAARRFLAGRTLDAILSDRNEISDAVRETVKDAATVYGVEIVRADVKDLVFPGNLREIMNQVLETERRAEAKLIQARKDIEARELEAVAQSAARMRALEAQRERLQLELLADREHEKVRLEKQRRQLEMEVEEAKAITSHPALLELRKLEALEKMAGEGARFVIGLDARMRLLDEDA